MKVKELIEYLKTLDQERGIWISYDTGYSIFPPIPDDTVRDQYIVDNYQDKAPGISMNDYIISAG